MIVKVDQNEILLTEAGQENFNDYMDFIYLLSQDPDNYTLGRYSKIDKGRTFEWSKSWGKMVTMILAYHEGRVIGMMQLSKGRYFGIERQSHAGELAYAILKDFRGKGLIYMLFSYLLKKVDTRIFTAWVDERNLKSQRVLDNLGFTRCCKIDEFMYSENEKTFVNLWFYSGNRDVIEKKIESNMKRFGIEMKP